MSLNTSYTIQMASKISGVGVHTIRAWEKRYKALEPNRDSIGHRTYTKTDVEKLMLLSELCLLGYAISKVAKLTIPELKLLLKDLGKSEESVEFPEMHLIKEKEVIDSSQSLSILIFALRAYKPDVINQELGKLKISLSPRELAIDIISPLSKEIEGRLKRGEMLHPQAEAIVALINFHAGHALYRTGEKRDAVLKNVIVTGIDNDPLDLNAVMCGLLTNHYGFNCTIVPINMSVEALSDTVGFLNSDYLVLSAQRGNKNLNFIQSYIERLLQKTQGLFEIFLNGSSDLNMEKIPEKRIFKISSINELDEFLKKKRN